VRKIENPSSGVPERGLSVEGELIEEQAGEACRSDYANCGPIRCEDVRGGAARRAMKPEQVTLNERHAKLSSAR